MWSLLSYTKLHIFLGQFLNPEYKNTINKECNISYIMKIIIIACKVEDGLNLNFCLLPCPLGQFNFDHFFKTILKIMEFRGNKTIFKTMAQGANDRLFYAEFRTVFLFSVCILDVLSFFIWSYGCQNAHFQNLKSKR